MKVRVAARSSPLSRAQVEEVEREIRSFYPDILFKPVVWVETRGDRDKAISLRTLGKSDFFTRELDEMLFKGEVRLAIHSAKDLSDPLPKGLVLIALTKGVDPRDSLVLQKGMTLKNLPKGARIATSSVRREETVRSLRPDLCFLDLRGTIGERLAKLDRGEVEGVIVAEAALLRLQLTHLNRLFLPGETAPLQGRLAVVGRHGDRGMQILFSVLSFNSTSA